MFRYCLRAKIKCQALNRVRLRLYVKVCIAFVLVLISTIHIAKTLLQDPVVAKSSQEQVNKEIAYVRIGNYTSPPQNGKFPFFTHAFYD